MMIDELMTSPVVCGLGWAVLHFFWQGCLIVGVAALFLRFLRGGSAQMRYGVGCIAMVCSLVVFAITFFAAIPSESTAMDGALMSLTYTPPLPAYPVMIPIAAWSWCFGVAWLLIRLSVQRRAVNHLKRIGTTEVDETTRDWFEDLCGKLGLNRPIRFLQSSRVDTPMVIGWVSPVLIIPVSVLTSLPPDQLQAVLAHEIAHIRRYDYLLNGIQNLIEIVLFFHPAVWWLSGQVRHEREQCCDDVAVRTSRSAIVYAQALSHLEALRDQQLQLALAANGGKLMNRIERILGIQSTAQHVASNWRILPVVLLAVVAAGIVHAATVPEDKNIETNPQLLEIQQALDAGTMTQQEAWREYFNVVYPGSETEKKIQMEYEDALKWIGILEKDGKISKEDAWKKRQFWEHQRDSQKRTAYAIHVLRQPGDEAYVESQRVLLEGMVRAGQISQEDMVRKLELVRRQVEIEKDYWKKFEQIKAGLEAQVEKGEMTREEADIQIGVVKQGVEKKIAFRLACEQIKHRVESGEITSEEADAMYEGVGMPILERLKAHREADWAEIERGIESAVERGEMSRDEADAKYMALRAAMEKRARLEADWAENEKLIEAAVERGELSREEADAKCRALREKKDQLQKTASRESSNG